MYLRQLYKVEQRWEEKKAYNISSVPCQCHSHWNNEVRRSGPHRITNAQLQDMIRPLNTQTHRYDHQYFMKRPSKMDPYHVLARWLIKYYITMHVSASESIVQKVKNPIAIPGFTKKYKVEKKRKHKTGPHSELNASKVLAFCRDMISKWKNFKCIGTRYDQNFEYTDRKIWSWIFCE